MFKMLLRREGERRQGQSTFICFSNVFVLQMQAHVFRRNITQEISHGLSNLAMNMNW